MDIQKTVFGFNLRIELDNGIIFNLEFREKDNKIHSDLTLESGWLLCAIINGTPVLGKEYWE